MSSPDSLGLRVRKARMAAGLTFQALAEASGVAISTIYLIESGKRQDVRVVTLRKLAQTLGVSLETLVEVVGAR